MRKPMARSSGKEILVELLHQLSLDDIRDSVIETTDVTPVMLPYASAMFAPRIRGGRPQVVRYRLHSRILGAHGHACGVKAIRRRSRVSEGPKVAIGWHSADHELVADPWRNGTKYR